MTQMLIGITGLLYLLINICAAIVWTTKQQKRYRSSEERVRIVAHKVNWKREGF